MKFLPLIWRNAVRSKRRTILTVLGVGVSLFILTTLLTFISALDAWEGQAVQHTRFVVMSQANLTTDLPSSHEKFIRGLPDVAEIDKSQWFGGIYGDEATSHKDFFAQFACDAHTYFTIFDDRQVDPATLEAFQKDRQAAVVAEPLMKRFNWKVGDRIVIKGTIFPVNLELNIVGTYRFEAEESVQFRYDYLEELLKAAGQPGGMTGIFWVKAKSPEAVPALMKAIDDHFANSPDPTKSMSEKEFGRMFIQMMGNVGGLVRMLGIAITVMIFCIMANTMAMAARERVVETAMMRTLGYTSDRILGLILAESLFVTLLGAALGVGAAVMLYNVMDLGRSAMFAFFVVTPRVLAISAGLTVAVGIGSGIVPALRSSRRKIVDGLRQVV